MGAVSGILGSMSQNSAVSRSMASANQAAALQLSQLSRQAGQAVQQNIDRSRVIEGRINVAQAASGGIDAGSLALIRQADFDEAANDLVIRTNYGNDATRVQSGLAATQQQFKNQSINPILAGLLGLTSDIQSGLSIYGAIPSDTPAPAGGSTPGTYGPSISGDDFTFKIKGGEW